MEIRDTNLQKYSGLIVHLCQRETWEAASKHGSYHAASLDTEGYIHCSRSDQILAVAKAFYWDLPDVILLWIDPCRVDVEIRWEQVGDDTYPHIYGELNTDAVVKVSDLNREVY